MADNLGYTPGTGETIRSKDRDGIHRQVLMLDVGSLAEVLLTVGQKLMASSLPVAIASDQSEVPISIETVPSHPVTNAGTFAVQVDGEALTALQSLLAGDTILIGTTAYTVKKQKIDRATSGELVAAVTGKKIRVIALYATVAADTTVTLKSASTTTGTFTTTGAMTWKAGGGMVLPRDPDGHVETTSGEGLNVTLGTACQISGMLKYVEV